MRTVISHFFNEEYLLPWWIKHHMNIFDYGILIDHGSTDSSLDIVRELAPNWRVVRSRLTHFDAFLNDLEVMNYEQELPKCWKIALNTTEFLLPTVPIDEIEKFILREGFSGVSTTGFIICDEQESHEPNQDTPIILQKTFGFDENTITDISTRLSHGLSERVCRNRFYHSNPAGMYHPGRHNSFHPDFKRRASFLLTAHLAYAPWNGKMKKRKMQISLKVPREDLARGWGLLHVRSEEKLDADYKKIKELCSDLSQHSEYSKALSYCKTLYKMNTNNYINSY